MPVTFHWTALLKRNLLLKTLINYQYQVLSLYGDSFHLKIHIS